MTPRTGLVVYHILNLGLGAGLGWAGWRGWAGAGLGGFGQAGLGGLGQLWVL